MHIQYLYTTDTYRRYKRWYKAGKTSREAAIRIDEQDGTGTPEPHIPIAEREVPNRIEDGMIRRWLEKNRGWKETRIDKIREWREVPAGQDPIEDWQAAINDLWYGVARPNAYKPRPEQKEGVSKATKWFLSGGTEFLFNVKMRGGKCFMSLLTAKKIGARSILILTYKPQVKHQWQDEVEHHIEFEGWHYSNGEGYNPKRGVVNVILASFQDINNFKKAKWRGITSHKFDLIIIDEMHYGSDTERAKLTLSNITGKRTLFVSGTPLDAIISGRFTDDNMYSWTYTDEQKKRRAEEEAGWPTKIYREMPQMEFYIFDVPEESKRNTIVYSDDEQFTLTKMFGSDNGKKFNDEASCKLFLDQQFGRGVRKEKSPFRIFAPDHSLWVMPPSTKSVDAMCILLEKIVGDEYNIINVSGKNIDSLTKVERRIKHHKKTITVTCGRFNTGVTVPEWDAVYMLNDCKAPETFFQTIFRVQSPDRKRNKEKCYVFVYNYEQYLDLVYTYGDLTAKKGQDITSSIRQFLEFAPAFDRINFKQISAEEVVSFVSEANRFMDKFASNYNLNPELASKFTELLQLQGGVNNVKISKVISTSDMMLGKNFNGSGRKPHIPSMKKLEEEIISKAKLVIGYIPEYVFFVDPVNSISEILKTDKKLFKEHFQISRDYFKDMVQTGFLNEDKTQPTYYRFKIMSPKKHLRGFRYTRGCMFVPPELTEEIISRITVPKNTSILVIFSYEMLPVLRQLGCSNVTLLFDKPRTSIYNIAKHYGYNTITFEELDTMKFDVIIGNPPYQKTKSDGSRYDTGSNLWSAFWSESIKTWSKDDGKISLITPTTWLAPSADLKGKYKINGYNRLWDIFNTYTSYADVKNVSKHFNGGSTFGYVYVDKAGKDGLKFSDGASTELGFLPNSNIEDVIQKMDMKKNLGARFTIQQTRDPEDRLCVLVPVTKSLKPNSIKILKSPGHNEQQDFYIYVNDKKQAKKVQKIIVEALDLLKHTVGGQDS